MIDAPPAIFWLIVGGLVLVGIITAAVRWWLRWLERQPKGGPGIW